MAGDMTRKPISGAPLNISAKLWERVIDVARGEDRKLTGKASPFFRQSDIVLVKNSTASAVNRYGIMGIDAPLITPTANENEFKRRVLLSCVAPLTATHKNKYVVLQEPLAAGAIGKAVIAGVTPVKVTGAVATFAEITSSDTTRMTMDTTGSARILWADSGSAERWAVVRINETPPPTASAFSGALISGSNSALVAPATWGTMSWASQEYDTDNYWAVGDPTKIYAPTNGYYAVAVSLYWRNLVTHVNAEVTVNDGHPIGYPHGTTSLGDANTIHQNISGILKLAANDFLKVRFLWKGTSGTSNPEPVNDNSIAIARLGTY